MPGIEYDTKCVRTIQSSLPVMTYICMRRGYNKYTWNFLKHVFQLYFCLIHILFLCKTIFIFGSQWYYKKRMRYISVLAHEIPWCNSLNLRNRDNYFILVFSVHTNVDFTDSNQKKNASTSFHCAACLFSFTLKHNLLKLIVNVVKKLLFLKSFETLVNI